MSEHAKELQERFADAAIALMMDQYAQEDGDALLRQYWEQGLQMPEQLDKLCRKTIQKAHKGTLMRSMLKRAARAAACMVILLALSFPLAMSVEAFRVPVLNFVLKHGNGFTGITFSRDSDSFDAMDQLRVFIGSAIPDGYEFKKEHVHVSRFAGTETPTSLLIRYANAQDAVLEILIQKAEGTLNFDSQDADVISMELSDQQAIFIAGDGELRVLWINEIQGQLYSITGYDTGPDAFWECAHTLSEATHQAQDDVIF